MSNYLDFLVALTEYTAAAPSGQVATGYEMHQIAWKADLADFPSTIAAMWTGQLVDQGYVEPGPVLGVRAAIPRRVSWTDNDLQSFSDYRVTRSGREEVARRHRDQRSEESDATLGFRLISTQRFGPDVAAAIGRPLRDLRAALEDERPEAVIGAAKELVEAACKVVLDAAGTPPGTRSSLPGLFADARRAVQITDGDLGRSLSATVQRLADLRNAVGAGHGRSVASPAGMAEARLAASTASGLAAFLISD